MPPRRHLAKSGNLILGACTYDVCTGRGRGNPQKHTYSERKLSKGSCVEMQTKREGVKISEDFEDVICTLPPSPPPLTIFFSFSFLPTNCLHFLILCPLALSATFLAKGRVGAQEGRVENCIVALIWRK